MKPNGRHFLKMSNLNHLSFFGHFLLSNYVNSENEPNGIPTESIKEELYSGHAPNLANTMREWGTNTRVAPLLLVTRTPDNNLKIWSKKSWIHKPFGYNEGLANLC
jgi:hypothetical protein